MGRKGSFTLIRQSSLVKMLLPLWCDSLTPELVEIAERELGETPEIRDQCIKELKGLIKDTPDFLPRTEDAFLIRYLRARKFDVKKSFRTLRNYYTFKARYSGILTDFRPSEVAAPLQQRECCLTVLEKRLNDCSAVGIIRPASFDLDVVTPNLVFASCLVCTEVLLELEPTQVCGYSIIFDLANMSFRLVKHFASPTFIYRLVRLVQDCVPCRIKGIHIVNEPLLFSAVFGMIKVFLSEKLAKRVHIHGSDLKSLHRHIPAEILPEELGGQAGPCNNSEFVARVMSREAHFDKINKYGYQGSAVQDVKRKNSRTLFD